LNPLIRFSSTAVVLANCAVGGQGFFSPPQGATIAFFIYEHGAQCDFRLPAETNKTPLYGNVSSTKITQIFYRVLIKFAKAKGAV